MDNNDEERTSREIWCIQRNFRRSDIIYHKYCIYQVLSFTGILNSLTGNLYCNSTTPPPRTPPIMLRTPVIALVQASLHSFFLLASGALHHHEVVVRSVSLSRTHRAIH